MYQMGLSEESTAPRLRAEALAIAGIVALQTILGRSRAVHWVGPLQAVAEAPKAPKAPRRAAARVVKPAKLTGEEFYDQWMAAIKAMRADLGGETPAGFRECETWHLRPEAWQWCTLPPKLTHLTTRIVDDGAGGKRGGVRLKWSKGQKLPAPRYWAGGVLPSAVVVDVLPPATVTPWVKRPWGKDGAMVAVHPMLARLADARADQIAADRPLRAAQLYRDALREMNYARDRLAGVGAYYPPLADRRANYRKAIAAAWALRAEVRALRRP
jgi:hypothetical protein